ncbi:MAG: ATP-dependent helicase PcrA [Pseudomonadota bacterium]|jgi:DNA helicase-2/ATP-dependent DNA helicase PcrA
MSDGLNPHQTRAVRTLSGPLLVLAGAGSGKTRVITFRIAELIKSGIKAERILAVTFTNKAAKEMKHRASALLSKRRRTKVTPEISTFHSLCVRILRRHIDRLGYPKQFPIYDSSDQESLARAALRDIRVGQDTLRPGELMSQIGSWKSQGLRPEAAEKVAQTEKQQLAAMAYFRYQASLKACGAVDFDDLLLCTEELFENFPDVRFAESSRFDHLLIDEYQDTNGLQYRIVKHLAQRHRNLCVVGDDDQSIYGWRGAEVTHILNFTKDWPDATVVRLEDNYRSVESVLKLANTLIAHNTSRHDKVLRAARKGGDPPRVCRFDDEVKEAESIAQEISGLINTESGLRVKPSDIAILFRTNEQPRVFELELRRQRIPYQLVGGMSFYDRKEVRDCMAYLKILAHPDDEVSLLRVINTPARGIGTASVQTLVEKAVAAGVPLWQVLPDAIHSGEVPHAVGERVESFRGMIGEFQQRSQHQPLVKTATELFERVDYKAELSRVYKSATDIEARWNSVVELINSIGLYEERADKPSLAEFLEETALAGREDPRDDKDKRQEHSITLMTLHSAKGLEFKHVYMVGMEEGLLPHQRSLLEGTQAIAEERRLAYVGVTRAQDVLTLSLAKQRMKWGKPRGSIISRFVLEMRGETEKALKAAQAAEEIFQKPSADPPVSGKSPGKKTSKRTAKKPPGNKPAKEPPGKKPAKKTSGRQSATTQSRGAADRGGTAPERQAVREAKPPSPRLASTRKSGDAPTE